MVLARPDDALDERLGSRGLWEGRRRASLYLDSLYLTGDGFQAAWVLIGTFFLLIFWFTGAVVCLSACLASPALDHRV